MIRLDEDRSRSLLTAIGTASYALADLRRLAIESGNDRGAAVAGKSLRDLAALERRIVSRSSADPVRVN